MVNNTIESRQVPISRHLQLRISAHQSFGSNYIGRTEGRMSTQFDEHIPKKSVSECYQGLLRHNHQASDGNRTSNHEDNQQTKNTIFTTVCGSFCYQTFSA
ncbi:unnamed protein product [Heterobilharzia americana]|nr:unnamed protein product [Heterobilharzia americana]